MGGAGRRPPPAVGRRQRRVPPPPPPPSTVTNFLHAGGIPSDPAAAWQNTATLNATLHALLPGDTLLIPRRTFHVMGGIEGVGLRDVTIQIDGKLIFSPDTSAWPRYADDITRRPGLSFWDAVGLTLTSSSQGVLDGSGRAWWSVPGIGYLIHTERRPRLLTVANSSDVLVEKLLLQDSPYWTTLFVNVVGLTVRYCGISARRTDQLRHSLVDLSAFNTDGFDVHGRDVHIHDCQIWSQDDAIAVKDYIADDYAPGGARGNHTPVAVPSEDMLFERINASGLGLTIGSIGEGLVRNITFRDCYLRHSVKGLYLKFRRGDNHTGRAGLIRDVTYEDIVLDAPSQWPIWLGPAQQADARNPCLARPCSLCWPLLPAAAGARCEGATSGAFEAIALRRVSIYAPRHAPGVLLADAALPMVGVTFEDVVTHRACGAASRYGADPFTTAFSRLPPTVAPDGAVRTLYALLAAGAAAAALLCACVAVRGGPRLRTLTAAVLAALAALCARLSAVAVRLHDESAYYVCTGVVGGVATGRTWPVPTCFRDATTPDTAEPPCADELSETARWAMISATLCVGAVCCVAAPRVAGRRGAPLTVGAAAQTSGERAAAAHGSYALLPVASAPQLARDASGEE